MKETTTYIIFNGNCREAMTFYAKCLEAELFLLPYSEMPVSEKQGAKNPLPEKAKDWVMHSRLTKGKGAPILMASDTRPDVAITPGDNFFVNITCESIPETEKLFAALGEKGQIKMPVQETFWATRFGMLTDQFGINWMLNLEKAPPK